MQIEQTVLPSGLMVITARLPQFATIGLGVFVGAGSRHEQDAISGLAHFNEHMAFKGTVTRPGRQIPTEIEELGAMVNASTSQYSTAYYASGLTEHVSSLVEILGDAICNSRYDPQDIDNQRDVILQEISQHSDNPGSTASRGFWRTAYAGQPIGRPILGNPEFVRAASREHFLEFVGANYSAKNTVVVCAGNLEHDPFCDLVETHFRGLQSNPRSIPPQARYEGGYWIDTSKDFTQVTLLLGFRGVPITDKRSYAYDLLAGALCWGISSPLFQEVHENRGLAYSVGSATENGPDFGFWIIHGSTTPNNLEEFFNVSCAEIIKMKTNVEERDLSRAKNLCKVGVARMKESPLHTAMYIGHRALVSGIVTTPDEAMSFIEAVTLEDVRTAAEEMLQTNVTLAMCGPVPDRDYLGIIRGSFG